MPLDGRIANPAASGVFLVAAAGWFVFATRWFGTVWKRRHLREPGGPLPVVTPRDLVDGRRWTPEGRVVHRAYRGLALRATAAGAALWLVLDWLF